MSLTLSSAREDQPPDASRRRSRCVKGSGGLYLHLICTSAGVQRPLQGQVNASLKKHECFLYREARVGKPPP